MFRKLGIVAALCLLAALAAGPSGAREIQKNESKETKNTAVAKDAAVAAGAKLYKRNCAVCHGNDGTGGNAPPRSSPFVRPVPDLTTLAEHHGGKFPGAYVEHVLQSGVKMPDHGPAEMPVWGTIFKSTTKSDEALVKERIVDLTAYLESLQTK